MIEHKELEDEGVGSKSESDHAEDGKSGDKKDDDVDKLEAQTSIKRVTRGSVKNSSKGTGSSKNDNKVSVDRASKSSDRTPSQSPHMPKGKPPPKFICRICNAMLAEIEELEYHIYHWHEGHKYICEHAHCYHVFSSHRTFVSHIKKMHKSTFFECKSELNHHLNSLCLKNPDCVIECVYCN